MTNMRKLIPTILLTLLLLALTGTAFALPAAPCTAVVNNSNASDRLNLRESIPKDGSNSGASKGKYYNGVQVTVQEYLHDGAWAYVVIGTDESGGAYGYMQTKYLAFGNDANNVVPAMPAMAVDNPKSTDRLNLRALPSDSSVSLNKYYNDTPVTILGVCSNGWVHVTVDGKSGYMMSKYLSGTVNQTSSTARVKNPNSKDRLHLRTSAKSSASTLGKYYNGVVVTLLSKTPSNGFYNVRVGNAAGGLTGWMDEDYLYFGTGSVASAMPTYKVDNPVSTDRLNLRATPSTSAKSLNKYYNGTSVTVMGLRTDGWVHVQVDDYTGFMQEEYLSESGGSTGGGSSANKKTAWVLNPNAADRLNLRTSAKSSAGSNGKYYNGTTVTILNTNTTNGYYQVQVGELTGWMDASYLTFTESSVTSAMPTYTVSNPTASDRLNLRAAPSTASASYGKFDNGTSVTVMGIRTDGWVHVKIKNQTGFMMSQYLTDGTQTDPQSFIAWVNNASSTERLHLRKGPSSSSASLGKYYDGTRVTLVNSVPNNGYCYVYIGGDTQTTGAIGGTYGYMAAKYLSFDWVAAATPIANYPGPVTLYATPSTSAKVVNTYPTGGEVSILGIIGDWWHVTMGDGSYAGYVPIL